MRPGWARVPPSHPDVPTGAVCVRCAASTEGFEPPTPRFVAGCAVRLRHVEKGPSPPAGGGSGRDRDLPGTSGTPLHGEDDPALEQHAAPDAVGAAGGEGVGEAVARRTGSRRRPYGRRRAAPACSGRRARGRRTCRDGRCAWSCASPPGGGFDGFWNDRSRLAATVVTAAAGGSGESCERSTRGRARAGGSRTTTAGRDARSVRPPGSGSSRDAPGSHERASALADRVSLRLLRRQGNGVYRPGRSAAAAAVSSTSRKAPCTSTATPSPYHRSARTRRRPSPR